MANTNKNYFDWSTISIIAAEAEKKFETSLEDLVYEFAIEDDKHSTDIMRAIAWTPANVGYATGFKGSESAARWLGVAAVVEDILEDSTNLFDYVKRFVKISEEYTSVLEEVIRELAG